MNDDLLLSLFGVRSCLGRGWAGTFGGGLASGVAATHSHRPSSHLYPETWTRRRGVCAVVVDGPPLVTASLPLKKCSSMSIPVCSRYAKAISKASLLRVLRFSSLHSDGGVIKPDVVMRSDSSSSASLNRWTCWATLTANLTNVF